MVSTHGYLGSGIHWARLNRRAVFFSIVGLVTSIAVLTTCLSFRSEGSSAGAYHGTFKASKDDRVQFSLKLDLTSFDFIARRSEFLVQLIPQNEVKTNNGTLSSNVKLDFLYYQKHYQAGQKPEPFFVTVPLLRGTIRDYPFDRFFLSFPIEAEITQTRNITETRISLVEAGITHHLRSHAVTSKSIEASADGGLRSYPKPSLLISVEIFRPGTAIMMSLSVTIIMWGFALATLFLTFEFLTSETRLSPVLLVVGPSILFILPSLRLAQPGIPDSGCLIDMAGFFWIMVLVSICSLVMIMSWIRSTSSHDSANTSSTSSFLNCRWAPTPPKQEPQYPSFHNPLPKPENTAKLDFLSGTFQTAPGMNPFTLKVLNPQTHSSIPTYI